ncbi:MAG: hypothetical protein BGO31_17200 [Bacteroidetes bacterium 43-16]|nr:MAG: hypothetical protein BGO31_17200 [Bacteroidetes bacterium 43-16]
MRNSFSKYSSLLIILCLFIFKMSYAQIRMEQTLEFNNDTLFVFNKNGKLGLGRDTGSVVFKYDSISLKGDFNLVMDKGKWGLIGNDNEVNIPLKYDGLLEAYQRYLLIARKGDKWGVIDEEDQLIVSFKYDKILQAFGSRELFFAEQKGKWGVINEEEKVILPFEYHAPGEGSVSIRQGYEVIIMKENGKLGIVDTKNKRLASIIYDSITYSNGVFYATKNGRKGVLDEKGKLLIPCMYDAIEFSHQLDLFLVRKDNKFGLLTYGNQPFLPITFNKLYLDILFLEVDTASAKIVVQKTDSSWQYLNVKDGSILQDKVSKDTVFKYYKTILFAPELMNEYLQQVQQEERTIAMTLDKSHQQLVNAIIAAKNGISIDFPDLHKTLIDFIPFSWITSVTKIRNYLLSLGYEVNFTDTESDGREKEWEVCFLLTSPDCDCNIGLSFYKADGEKYKMVESLKCNPKNQQYKRNMRYRDLK